MKADFFIDRPVFSTVLSIIIVIVGFIGLALLPVDQYPQIVPPVVRISASYPGADAQTVTQAVATPIEQELNGTPGMIYMESSSSNSGGFSATVTFDISTDPDLAAVDIQNRLKKAEARLPAEVVQNGISVEKQAASKLMTITLLSSDPKFDEIYLSNYATLNVLDMLRRVPGVGSVSNVGSRYYAMQIWVMPDKLADLGLTVKDLQTALKDQNRESAAGVLGQAPMNGIDVTIPITAQGRLSSVSEFEDIVVRANPDGSIIRLKDVARISLEASSYNTESGINGGNAAVLNINMLPGANAMEVATSVKAAMDEIAGNFPEGISYEIPFDMTTYISESIHHVYRTLFEALLLVILVVFLSLQSWRATLIPIVAVPISLIGTFGVMLVFGFSLNMLTLLGLILAIGIVVDDAIVVLENVERHISDGLPPRKATAKAMQEVTGPVIAIVLVLCAVFIPVAFTGGMAGRMYQQFAITIAVSVVISGAVALTFTPALCALLLKPGHGEPNVFFRKFNGWFEGLTGKYVSIVKLLLRRSLLAVGLFVLVLVGIGGVFERVPGGLVPDEDQGYLIALMTMPDGAAISRTSAVVEKLDKAIMADPLVADVMSFSGMDAVSGAAKTNVATFFFTLKPWGERKAPGDSSFDLARKLYGMGFGLEQGSFIAFNPPPISGMSNTGGFEMWLQDRNGRGSVELSDVAQKLAEAANKRPELQGVSTSFTVNAPQLFVELDREKARTLGVNVSDVFQTMQATFGSSYINDFNLYGRTFRVYTQSEKDYRARPEDLAEVYVRNKQDEMIPLTALINVKPTSGPQTVERFNNFQAAKFMGNPATGYSSGQAMTAMEEVAKEVLPDGYTIAWSGSSYQEKLVSSGGSLVFVLALVMVFLILAAQYESWSLPLTVLTAVPFGVLGAITAIWLRGISNDVYFQVALVTLIGLSAKNAILIVEFAVEQYRNEGKDAVHAAEEAARLRFRPIVMTSLAFILGCVPLAVSTGAGAASRHAIGTSVIGGMLVATLVAPLFVPFFFRWIMRASEKLMGTGKKEE